MTYIIAEIGINHNGSISNVIKLAKLAKTQGIDLSILQSAIKTNNKIRSKYESLDKRESEQNISFDDKI